LGQMLYWTRHGRDIEPNAGWFHKTAQQWTRETGLSRREQCSARRKLVQQGLMEERRAGIPATLHFRLHLDRIALGLGALIGRPAGAIDWQNPDQVADWLGASSTYYPRLTEITGSVNSALILSRALVLTRHLHADAMG